MNQSFGPPVYIRGKKRCFQAPDRNRMSAHPVKNMNLYRMIKHPPRSGHRIDIDKAIFTVIEMFGGIFLPSTQSIG